MKLGKVIGRVTLNIQVPSFQGGRWLIVNPLTKSMLERAASLSPADLSKSPSLIVYDEIGAGVNDIIGYIEGREAAVPFDEPTPVDAYCAAIIDHVDLFRQ